MVVNFSWWILRASKSYSSVLLPSSVIPDGVFSMRVLLNAYHCIVERLHLSNQPRHVLTYHVCFAALSTTRRWKVASKATFQWRQKFCAQDRRVHTSRKLTLTWDSYRESSIISFLHVSDPLPRGAYCSCCTTTICLSPLDSFRCFCYLNPWSW